MYQYQFRDFGRCKSVESVLSSAKMFTFLLTDLHSNTLTDDGQLPASIQTVPIFLILVTQVTPKVIWKKGGF
jgi:hypothetical protein